MNIRKYLLSGAFAVAMFAAMTPAAQSAQVTGNFNVTVALTSVCTMAAIGDLAFGTYTAFQAAPLVATPTTATLTCTRTGGRYCELRYGCAWLACRRRSG